MKAVKNAISNITKSDAERQAETNNQTTTTQQQQSSTGPTTQQARASQSGSAAAVAGGQPSSQTVSQTTVTQGGFHDQSQSRGPPLGTYENVQANQATSAVTQVAMKPTFHQETQVIQSQVGGLNVQPIQASVNTDQLYKDYLPNRNNMWLQSLITKMTSMSLEIDQHAKASQEVISQEAAEEINRVIAVNKQKEAELIESMHAQALGFEREYAAKKEALVKKLDIEQQVVVERLQEKLQSEQQKLAQQIRNDVERIGKLAKEKKITILAEAQEKQDALGQVTQQTTTNSAVNVHASDLSKHHLFDKNSATGIAEGNNQAQVEKTEQSYTAERSNRA